MPLLFAFGNQLRQPHKYSGDGVKIYTSYFAKVKNLPADSFMIAVSIAPPYYMKCGSYAKLAPTRSILEQYKKDGDVGAYTEKYKELVLGRLSPEPIYKELVSYAKQKGVDKVFLLCYEGMTKFCHRHLISEWFRNAGLYCEEYK